MARYLAIAIVAMLMPPMAEAQNPPHTLLDSIVLPGVGVHGRPHEGWAAVVASVAAKQFSSETGLFNVPEKVSPEHITVSRLDSIPAFGLQLWRAELSSIRPHWPPYLVAVSDSALIRLGGFPAPELFDLSPSFSTDLSSEDVVAELSRLYAKLADPNGAVEIVFLDDTHVVPSDHSIIPVWTRYQPVDWPSSDVEQHSDGGFSVRLTVLSRAAHNSWAGWSALVYAFEFDATLRLTAWARQSGVRF